MLLRWILLPWWKVLIHGQYICDMKNGRTRMCFYVDISWIYFSTYTWYELKFKLYIIKLIVCIFDFLYLKKKMVDFFHCNRFCLFTPSFKHHPFGTIKDCLDLRIWFIGRNCTNGLWILSKHLWWMEVISKS